MKNQFVAIIVCFSFLLASSITTEAKEPSFYVGAGLGQTQTSLSSSLSKNSDTSYSLTGGIQINPNFSTELEYINLGKVTLGSGSANSDGFAAILVGILPMRGNVALFGKFGLARITTSWDTASTVNPSSQTQTGITWGLGGELDFTPRNGIRLTYDSYQIGTTDPMTGNSGTIMLSLLYRF